MRLISLYEARARATGGRMAGTIETADGKINLRLGLPPEMGGAAGARETGLTPPNVVNPEQLFACAWAASLADAIGFVAKQRNLILREIEVTAIVRFGQYEADGFGITTEFEIELNEISKSEAGELIAAAQITCPYSKAWKTDGGNLKVTIL